eukprot:1196183-Prorocentrum_minimum.AAC.4
MGSSRPARGHPQTARPQGQGTFLHIEGVQGGTRGYISSHRGGTRGYKGVHFFTLRQSDTHALALLPSLGRRASRLGLASH